MPGIVGIFLMALTIPVQLGEAAALDAYLRCCGHSRSLLAMEWLGPKPLMYCDRNVHLSLTEQFANNWPLMMAAVYRY